MRTDRDTTSGDRSADEPANQALNLSVVYAGDLEAAVARLEVNDASLQDTHDLEERIFERLTSRLKEDFADKISSLPLTAPPEYRADPPPSLKSHTGNTNVSLSDAD